MAKPKSAHAKRKQLTIDNLKTNHITICRQPNSTHWPRYVEELESKLLNSFMDLIPITNPKKESWQNRVIPAVDLLNWKGLRGVLSGPEKRLRNSAQDINERCKKNSLNGAKRIENEWSKLWAKIFETHLSEEHTNALSDVQFVKVTAAKLYDVEDCQLTQPKPDITLTLDVSNPRKKVLEKLWKEYGLFSSPFQDDLHVCFPWGIFEGKSVKNTRPPYAECQAANAAVKCLRMLENLKKVPGFPQEYQGKNSQTLPIPCFTCKGPVWELWICYKSGEYNSQPTYVQLDRIFGGDMNEMWSCLQLMRIVESLNDWALNVFKPWVKNHLGTWEKYAEENPRLVEPFGIPLPNREAKVPQGYTAQDEYSEGDSGIVIKDDGVGEYQEYGYGVAYPGQESLPVRPLEVQLPKQEVKTPQGYTAQHEYNKRDSGIVVKGESVGEHQKYGYKVVYPGQESLLVRPLRAQLPKQEVNISQGYTVQHEYNKENPEIAIKDKNVEEYQKYSASYRAAYLGQGLPLVRPLEAQLPNRETQIPHCYTTQGNKDENGEGGERYSCRMTYPRQEPLPVQPSWTGLEAKFPHGNTVEDEYSDEDSGIVIEDDDDDDEWEGGKEEKKPIYRDYNLRSRSPPVRSQAWEPEISLLNIIVNSPVPGKAQPPPPSVEVDDEEEYEVEEILDSRMRYRKLQYLVKWQDSDVPTWEPVANLDVEDSEPVNRFHILFPRKPRPAGYKVEAPVAGPRAHARVGRG